jgi:hypothetical protein
MAAGATYEPIATTTLGTAASTITFSSISSAYTDLKIVLVGTITSVVDLIMQYNSDTATNYSYTRLQGNGTATSTDTTPNNADIRISFGNPSTSVPFMITNDIFSYAGSTFKSALTTYSGDTNGAGSVGRTISTWRSTSAITSVVMTASGSTWKVGTTATLYGILRA